MTVPITRHQIEIERNLQAWKSKRLLQDIYAGFYSRILTIIDRSIPGKLVELGSGIGNLKAFLPDVFTTDLMPNPWLDMVCDAYDLPFADGSVSHLILFDVFHHLRSPGAFLREAHRALSPSGRIILFEPYISLISLPIYALFHHEPIGWNDTINCADSAPTRHYYAAQGNATRLFFRHEVPDWPREWTVIHSEVFSSFHYFLSGGYSKPAFYPAAWLELLRKLDIKLSRWPNLFGGRCIIGLCPSG